MKTMHNDKRVEFIYFILDTWEIITKIDVSTTSYTVTDLDSEATYCFRIRAVARHNLFSTWGPKEGLQLEITGWLTFL